MKLPEIETELKTGQENFTFQDKNFDFKLTDFWTWNQSNLIENRTRGILAEFIVKQALKIDSNKRIEWDNFDLISKTGKKIEIKSAAYLQSWEQKDYSKISFGIEETIGAKDHPEYDGKKRRWSDFYVFCLLKNKDQSTINPLELDQWTFYVIKTEILNAKIKGQKRISLNSLKTLNPVECDFKSLKKIIDE